MSQPPPGQHPGEQHGPPVPYEPGTAAPQYGAPQQAQPWDGAPQYPQPQYGAPQYGAPQYPQPQYGAPQYGAPQYPQPQYGPPPYGQPPYGVPQYPQAPWQYPAGPPRRNRAALIWSLVGGAVLVAALVLAVVVVASGAGSRGPAPVSTAQPVGLGFDPTLNRLAQQCFDGRMAACDELFDDSDVGSDYEHYGDTCAGRQPAGQEEYCTDVFADS